MSKSASRRLLLSMAAVASLSGCQIAEEGLYVRVDDEATPAFLNAVKSFARDHGYSSVVEGEGAELGYQILTFEDLRSVMWVDGAAGCGYAAHFQNNDEWWAALLPRRDLVELKGAFESAIVQVEGVEIVEVSGIGGACGLE